MLNAVNPISEPAPPAGCLSRSSVEGQGAVFSGLMRQASAPASTPSQQHSILDPVADRMLCLDGQAAQLVVSSTRLTLADPPAHAAPNQPEAPAEAPQLALVQPSTPPFMPTGTGAARELDTARKNREDFARLGMGDSGPDVSRVQRVLKKWNRHLDLEVSGTYDEPTRRAVHLYKAIYGTGRDGRSLDARTSDHLARMEDGTFWNDPPEKSLAGRILYAASQDLGKPYRMGGDGERSTDCAMLTREALRRAGAVGNGFTRLADSQYYHAERNSQGLTRVQGDPKAGDLVFFDNPTHQSSVAYRGITHVGLYLGDGYMLAASSGHGRVVVQPIEGMSRHIAGYARAAQ